MGWTSMRFTETTHKGFQKKHLEEFLQRENYNAEKVHLHRNDDYDEHECYAVMRSGNGQLFIAVILIKIENNQIYWKDMDESQGPCAYNCPTSFFKYVPTPPEGYAKAWREKCTKAVYQ